MLLEQSSRIEWIDIAKGIAIILVIIGHTVKFGSLTRNIIFSFHMPLFFMLSGYTYRPATEVYMIVKHIKKNVIHLLVPCLIVSSFIACYWIVQSGNYSLDNVKLLFSKMVRDLFYASGVRFRGSVAGMVWFIFSLFWSKVLIDCIYTFQKNEYKYCTIGCLAFFGICLGTSHNWLFQNFDVTFVSVLFVYVGMLWRDNSKLIDRYSVQLFFASLAIWSFLIGHGIYIEMAGRRYPYYSVSIIEAIVATFVFCSFCKACLDMTLLKRLAMVLGADSMVLFYLHHCDSAVSFLWRNSDGMTKTIVIRLCVILLAYSVYKTFNYLRRFL